MGSRDFRVSLMLLNGSDDNLQMDEDLSRSDSGARGEEMAEQKRNDEDQARSESGVLGAPDIVTVMLCMSISFTFISFQTDL